MAIWVNNEVNSVVILQHRDAGGDQRNSHGLLPLNSLDANVKDGGRVAAGSQLEEDRDEACAEK